MSEEQWYLAQWTIVIPNVPSKRLALPEVFVRLGLRWQIELLFKRWKSAAEARRVAQQKALAYPL